RRPDPGARRRAHRRARHARRTHSLRRVVRRTAQETAARRGAGGVVSAHDEDVLGKAYDAQLMRRLIAYLRPYRPQVAVAFAAITVGAIVALAQPYLIKVAIDEYIAKRQIDGLDRLAVLYVVLLVAGFTAEYVQTWTMQLTGQRIMFDMRMAIYGHLQRLD